MDWQADAAAVLLNLVAILSSFSPWPCQLITLYDTAAVRDCDRSSARPLAAGYHTAPCWLAGTW